MNPKYNCPNCHCEEFITEPNQYDVLNFTEKGFEIKHTEQIEDFKTYCRECGKEVDVFKSITKIILKTK